MNRNCDNVSAITPGVPKIILKTMVIQFTDICNPVTIPKRFTAKSAAIPCTAEERIHRKNFLLFIKLTSKTSTPIIIKEKRKYCKAVHLQNNICTSLMRYYCCKFSLNLLK